MVCGGEGLGQLNPMRLFARWPLERCFKGKAENKMETQQMERHVSGQNVTAAGGSTGQTNQERRNGKPKQQVVKQSSQDQGNLSPCRAKTENVQNAPVDPTEPPPMLPDPNGETGNRERQAAHNIASPGTNLREDGPKAGSICQKCQRGMFTSLL